MASQDMLYRLFVNSDTPTTTLSSDASSSSRCWESPLPPSLEGERIYWKGNSRPAAQADEVGIYRGRKLVFSDFAIRIETSEKQTVNIDTAGSFRLGMYGVFTNPLTVYSKEDQVEDAFNSLPCFNQDEHVFIKFPDDFDKTGVGYELTFSSKQGDFPAVDVMNETPDDELNKSQTEDVRGAPDMDMLALEFGGVTSSSFSLSDLTVEKLKAALDTMFSARCPEMIKGASPETKSYQSFEDDSGPLNFVGIRTKETEPFCGRYSLKNPEKIYKTLSGQAGISVSNFNQLCLAYKGRLKDSLSITYSYKNSPKSTTQDYQNRGLFVDTVTWRYTCINIYDLVKFTHPDATVHRIEAIEVKQQDVNEDIFVDDVYIGADVTTPDTANIGLHRMAPSMPGGVLIDTVNVSSDAVNEFTVAFKTFECGHNLPLLQLAHSEVSIPGRDTAVYKLLNGGAGRMSSSRLTAASPPVTGSVSVEFNGSTLTGLGIELEAPAFESELEFLEGIDDVTVERTGDCAIFDLAVTFQGLAGDLPEMHVTPALHGIDAVVLESYDIDGGLVFDPVTADMAFTVQATPQVRLFINDVPVACDSADCSLRWTDDATPTVTRVSPNTGTLGLAIDIEGTKFSETLTENRVEIGGVTCNVTGATTTVITCTVSNCPMGRHKVKVNVKDKGDAAHHDGDVTFECTAAIGDVSPRAGSLGGGKVLSVTGHGFGSSAVVTVGSAVCPLVGEILPHLIQCLIPSSTSAGSVDVTVSQDGGNLVDAAGYTYDVALTTIVDDVSPTTLGVLGGSIAVTGTFTESVQQVLVGDQEATLSGETATQLVVEVGQMEPGVYDLLIVMESGNAVSRAYRVPRITVSLEISHVYPRVGSVQGGTKLTIAGTGFGTDRSLLDVKVGEHTCNISTLENMRIVCQIADTRKTHHVTNRGSHPVYKKNYAFAPQHITIPQGDGIRWSWYTPPFIKDINHAVIEVDSPSTMEATAGGFSSGPPSPNGEFQHEFRTVRTVIVSSGYVDTHLIKNYMGKIDVIPKPSSVGEVSVRIAGKEALHRVASGAADPVDTSACEPFTADESSCADIPQVPTDAAKFMFIFSTCHTPIVNTIDRNTGTINTLVTLTGEGFSPLECRNELAMGEFGFDVTSATGGVLTGKLAMAGEPHLAVSYPMSMRLNNHGFATINIKSLQDCSYRALTSIESTYPVSGSLAGGTSLRISGYGFDGTAVATVGGSPCSITSRSYTEIMCDTPASASQGLQTIEVRVYISGLQQLAECDDARECVYSYIRKLTPKVATIKPSSGSTAQLFSLRGVYFGSDPSAVSVTIGGVPAIIESATSNKMEAMMANVPVGENNVVVKVDSAGLADCDLIVTGEPEATSVDPLEGSVHGGTLITLHGSGFVAGDTNVTVGGSPCTDVIATLSAVTCITSPHADGDVTVEAISKSVPFPPVAYGYSSDVSPTIDTVDPPTGLAGEEIIVRGSNYGDDYQGVTVLLDEVECEVLPTSTPTEIHCTVGNNPTGEANVYVHVAGHGAANIGSFTLDLQLDFVDPNTGGTAGGQRITLTGAGFEELATVTICGQDCQHVSSTSTAYTCITAASTERACGVEIAVNGLTASVAAGYTYNVSLIASIATVMPRRGSTAGTTSLTITGTGFGSTKEDISVDIDGAPCAVDTVEDTAIECTTGPHPGSIQTTVNVQRNHNGNAQLDTPEAANFEYMYVWSSMNTWGGESLPAEGEFVVVPEGMTLLLDTDTPVLEFLLIKGELIFNEQDVELQAKNIMITSGGALQIGTEDEPFQHRAIITLHGHQRNRELPTYGTKGLAVRNGHLDMHGIPVVRTWTYLGAEAEAGTTTITLKQYVDWKIGDEIVIATTGQKASQGESEKRRISDVSDDGLALTLDSALEYTHICMVEDFDGRMVEFCAEVGLLSHNILFRGNDDPQYHEEIKACDQKFQPGEFDVLTCFLGRFGDEIGSSQFGAHLIVHGVNKHDAVARLSYIEFNFVGQANRLGRYPIHFHRNGDMSTSYVRGVGIHKSFNRAVNLHDTHYTLVEHVVIYDIAGGAFFLEDGIEIGNTLQYNLAVFVKQSSSLLNDDITPASFWILNGNNTVQHNAAAGGTHFGFWYRMLPNPTGPSFTRDVCPVNVPLAVFYNNTAHSMGWFGLWVFEHYYPMQGGCGGTVPQAARFETFLAWHCDKGAEFVNFGALQAYDFILVENFLAGFQGKMTKGGPLYSEEGPLLTDSLIVAQFSLPDDELKKRRKRDTSVKTKEGVVFPHGQGFLVQRTTFINFDSPSCKAFGFNKLQCPVTCGGYTYHTRDLKFINCLSITGFDWEWQGIIKDLDGSLTGNQGYTLLPTSGTVPPDCISAPEKFNQKLPASICPAEHKWHRKAFNKIVPESLQGNDFVITNRYGSSFVPMAKKRSSHPEGWVLAILGGETHNMSFANVPSITNISYDARYDDFQGEDYLKVSRYSEESPDRFSSNRGETFTPIYPGSFDASAASDGDCGYDPDTRMLSYVVAASKRSKRDLNNFETDRTHNVNTYLCYYDDCVPPPDPDSLPPADMRPDYAVVWSEIEWNLADDGYVENSAGIYGLPRDGDNVRILADTWVVATMAASPYTFSILLLEGVVEYDDVVGADYKINADHVIIKGGRLIIGWPDNPFDGLATITLNGHSGSSIYVAVGNGPNIGSKAIAVFGGLDLFGTDEEVVWTMLATTATAGSRQISLAETVNWLPGDTVVVGPTGYTADEVDVATIESTDGTTLTLTSALQYTHTAHYETLTGASTTELKLAAPVAKLNRNIKVVGEDNGLDEPFGGRVLVGMLATNERTYTGYARLSNVEFKRMGQMYFTKSYDPRFAVAFVATGTVSEAKPSFLSKNVYHDLYSSAIGAFGIGSVNISDNIVYGSVGSAIVTDSDDTRLTNNIIIVMQWTGTYGNNFERFNFLWEAGIETFEATYTTMHDNLVTGSQRYGFHVNLLPCDDQSGRYSNNRAFSSLIGIGILPDDEITGDCVMIQGFVLWKNHDFGIYYQNVASLKIDLNIIVENRQGVFPRVNEPASLSHETSDKTITVSNTVFVGQIASFDCVKDLSPSQAAYIELSSLARPGLAPNRGMIGLTFPNFMSGSNSAPKKPFINDKKYPAISGLAFVTNATFVHYGASLCSGSYAIGSNVGNHDFQHPIHSNTIDHIDVDDDFMIFYHEPVITKINSADCVDMDCDAMKKTLIKDQDGTLLGTPGAVLPLSEFEWGGDPRRGLGDYRIPTEMLTYLNGTRIPVDSLAPNKGIIRDNTCMYRPTWNAYQCSGLNYEVLVIESMDEDTETRRLSPVAILGRGYVDLINGPQDHGCCSGYGCRKRISTFYGIVASDEEYLVHFTGTNAFVTRYRLLNVDSDTSVKLNIWYSRPNRLDVHVDGAHKWPTNVKQIADKPPGLFMPIGDEYNPQLTDAVGTNFMQYTSGILSIIVTGTQAVEVRTAEVVVVSFSLPAMTEADLYGDHIVEYLAEFLQIPASKVRVVNIVNNGVGSRRRRRSTTGITLSAEIGDEPVAYIGDAVVDPIDHDGLLKLAAAVVNVCQLGNVSALLNTTSFCKIVLVPTTMASEDVVTYSTPVPDRLVLTVPVTPSPEGRTFQRQPRLQVNSSNVVVRELGTVEQPWRMSVSIRPGTGHAQAILLGTTNVTSTNGWFIYTDLSISHMATGYVLDFAVVSPAAAANFTISTAPFDVSGRAVKANVVSMTTSLVKDSSFIMMLDLRDPDTGNIISDIAWRNHSWTAEARLLGSPKYGSINGSLDTEFDAGTGQALFPDFVVTGFGLFYIQFHVMSTPADFDFTYNYKLRVENPLHVNMVPQGQYTIQVQFGEDYDMVLTTEDKENEFEQNMLQTISYRWPNIRMRSGGLSRGSIVITFVIDGSMDDLNSTAYNLCDSIHSSTEYDFDGQSLTMSPYLTINGETYYGVNCGDLADDEDSDGSDGMKPYLIAIIVLLCVLMVAATAGVLVWCFVVKPHSQTHDITANRHFQIDEHQFREDTFTSMKFRMPSEHPLPPSSTRITPRLLLLNPLDAVKLPTNAGRLTPITKVDVTDRTPSAGSRRSDTLYDNLHSRATTDSPSPSQETLTYHGAIP